MKGRSQHEVLDFLDEDFAWRRKELSTIGLEASDASSGIEQLRLRTALCPETRRRGSGVNSRSLAARIEDDRPRKDILGGHAALRE
jgi:hypothetical protein